MGAPNKKPSVVSIRKAGGQPQPKPPLQGWMGITGWLVGAFYIHQLVPNPSSHTWPLPTSFSAPRRVRSCCQLPQRGDSGPSAKYLPNAADAAGSQMLRTWEADGWQTLLGLHHPQVKAAVHWSVSGRFSPGSQCLVSQSPCSFAAELRQGCDIPFIGWLWLCDGEGLLMAALSVRNNKTLPAEIISSPGWNPKVVTGNSYYHLKSFHSKVCSKKENLKECFLNAEALHKLPIKNFPWCAKLILIYLLNSCFKNQLKNGGGCLISFKKPTVLGQHSLALKSCLCSCSPSSPLKTCVTSNLTLPKRLQICYITPTWICSPLTSSLQNCHIKYLLCPY